MPAVDVKIERGFVIVKIQGRAKLFNFTDVCREYESALWHVARHYPEPLSAGDRATVEMGRERMEFWRLVLSQALAVIDALPAPANQEEQAA